ncbi:hypothetical protein K450DRAFT_273855 [Umbelopsis ramanniana AG]|uniref:Uncharacterized protein n=1 Tax=Umbelopsis ramanniana AG TaxID=1314678 RepID=A0AAD5E620_UMBRA|nr:uncharacterized protein K450DRAFT_273855 [Umbelopsis ramanniana AG]KAI8577392.1 hypothetical protein K450DRAFT_273855 [Umbelopsis ramanniana AG]
MDIKTTESGWLSKLTEVVQKLSDVSQGASAKGGTASSSSQKTRKESNLRASFSEYVQKDDYIAWKQERWKSTWILSESGLRDFEHAAARTGNKAGRILCHSSSAKAKVTSNSNARPSIVARLRASNWGSKTGRGVADDLPQDNILPSKVDPFLSQDRLYI